MKKKVTIINFWDKGGMAHYSEALIGKIKDDYDVTYLSNYKKTIDGVNTLCTDVSLNPIANRRLIFKKIEQTKPEIIHFTSSHPANLFLYQKLKEYKTVLTIHDAKSHEGEKVSKRIFHTLHLRLASVFIKNIIVHSRGIKNDLPNYFRNKKIFIMQHSDYSHLANTKKKSGGNKKFTILFFGRILDYKGLKYLVDAFQKLPEEKYKLIIAGDGDINCDIPKNKDVEIFNEFISDKKMGELFRRSDISVLPYISASQSGVAYLSLAFDKPVIATRVGALPEVVNSRNGILINSMSVNEIKKSIEKMGNKKTYKKLTNNIKKDKLNNKRQILKIIGEIYYDETQN
jgi:alpha-maltose-1-phosphate synthase